jgi:SAM-dependent methyltransferase
MEAKRVEREQSFWDQAAPAVTKAWRQYERAQAGVEPNVQMAIDALGPLDGLRVLDFACGAGVLSCLLASRGAEVTAIDLSPVSIEVACELASRAQVDVRFLAGDLLELELAPGCCDAIIGIYALHHVDISAYAPALAALLTQDGRAAFLETMAANPLLRFARRHLVGHLGIPRLGSPDEHPLTDDDVAFIGRAFGKGVHVGQAEYLFVSMIDRQALYGRYPRVDRTLGAIDRQLARIPPMEGWSYRQVITIGAEPWPPR